MQALSIRVFAVLVCIALSASGAAQNNKHGPSNSKILKEIRETADSICNVSLDGQSSSTELTAAAKVELSTLFKRLGAAGVAAAGRYSNSKYRNVLQKDLASVVQKSLDCKERVFDKLSDTLLVPTQAGDESGPTLTCQQKCQQVERECMSIEIGRKAACREKCATVDCIDECDLTFVTNQLGCKILLRCEARCNDE